MKRTRKILTTLLLLSSLAAPPVSFAAESEDRFPLPPKEWRPPVEDDHMFTFVLFDQLEYQRGEDDDARVWDVQGWIGGDYHKFWFKTEGESEVGHGTEESEVQALYALLISPFWYLQAGLRYDARPTPTRTYAVLGLQGLALYWFELEATAFVSDEGDVSARVEAEYDLPITQRLVLQPQVETEFAASSDEARGIGRGFNDVTLALRLRYEIKREIAPYVGVTWTRALGDTADLVTRSSGDIDRFAIVGGLRLWF